MALKKIERRLTFYDEEEIEVTVHKTNSLKCKHSVSEVISIELTFQNPIGFRLTKNCSF